MGSVLDRREVEFQYLLKNIALEARHEIILKYGDIHGKDIEAVDIVVKKLKHHGVDCKTVKVYCLYQHFNEADERCFKENWICKITHGKVRVYVDVLMDQFQPWFYIKLPGIYIYKKR